MPDAPKRIGASEFVVGDSQIWAEIYYLDSQTDYLEYLPGRTSQASVGYDQIINSELQMLDELPSRPAILLSRVITSRVVATALGRLRAIRRMLAVFRSA